MKSANEEISKSKFDSFLKERSLSLPIEWKDGDEPPDYYLSVDGTRYAVEVTRFVENLVVGASTISRLAVIASLTDFVEEVEQITRTRKILRGTYIVGFSKPIENFREVKDEIGVALLQYIEKTRDSDREFKQVVFKHGRQSCDIQKLNLQADRIRRTGPHGVKWEGEVATDACNLLLERLTSKRAKLANVALPKIVLLYDSYHFADLETYRDCVSKLPSFASFHTVFLVQCESEGLVLYSQNLGWLGKPR